MSERVVTYGFWAVFAVAVLFQMVRYVVLSGLTYGLLWVKFREWTERRRVQPQAFRPADLKREIRDSVLFNIVTALPVALLAIPEYRSHTQIYYAAHEHSLFWIPFAFFALLFGQDTWVYWIHRWLHENKFMFRTIHIVHHHSTNPSPLATFAFHPIEGIMLAGFNVAFVFLVPTYFFAFGAYQVAAIAFNLNGHLGADILPQSWRAKPLLKYLNRADIHGDHHRFFNWNYAPFFTHWDHWMGTYRGRNGESTD